MNLLTALGLASMIFVAWFTRRAYLDNTSVDGEQTRREAIVEAWVNIVFGFSINFVCNLLLLPLMAPGGHLTLASNFWGGWIFTTISIVRQYAIRRWAARRIRAFSGWLATRISTLSTSPAQ